MRCLSWVRVGVRYAVSVLVMTSTHCTGTCTVCSCGHTKHITSIRCGLCWGNAKKNSDGTRQHDALCDQALAESSRANSSCFMGLHTQWCGFWFHNFLKPPCHGDISPSTVSELCVFLSLQCELMFHTGIRWRRRSIS